MYADSNVAYHTNIQYRGFQHMLCTISSILCRPSVNTSCALLSTDQCHVKTWLTARAQTLKRHEKKQSINKYTS